MAAGDINYIGFDPDAHPFGVFPSVGGIGRTIGRTAGAVGNAIGNTVGRAVWGLRYGGEGFGEKPDAQRAANLKAIRAAQDFNPDSFESRIAAPDLARPTASADRMANLSQSATSRITGRDPDTGRLNVSVGGTNFTNVSPAFAKTAGVPGVTPEIESTGTANFNAARQAAATEAQKGITAQLVQNQSNLDSTLRAQRAGPTPTSGVGWNANQLTDNEKMERYGTRFPNELPLNPTYRDVQNFRDYAVRSRLVPTSNPNVGAGATSVNEQ